MTSHRIMSCRCVSTWIYCRETGLPKLAKASVLDRMSIGSWSKIAIDDGRSATRGRKHSFG